MSGTRASYSLDGGGFNHHGASSSSQLHHRRPDLKKKLVVVRPTSYLSPPVNPQSDPASPDLHLGHRFKVGDGGCGKTCLLIVYAENRFPEVLFPFPLTHSPSHSPTCISYASSQRSFGSLLGIHPNCIRKLCHPSLLRGQGGRTSPLGYCRPRRI